MARNAFETSIERIKSVWGPLSTEVVAGCRRHLEELLKSPVTEDWLSALHRKAPASEELYRDRTNGFVLLAHTEYAGLYRPPHDHGRGWVIYALQRGEIEMGTYARIENPDGRVKLVKRDSTLVRPGQVQVYLGGQGRTPSDEVRGAERCLDCRCAMNSATRSGDTAATPGNGRYQPRWR